MPTISLCMIVKNEEMHITRCLKSVADLVDEIIVVDTGSEDRTVEIVSQYTAKIFPMPGTILFQRRRWISVCGWMPTMYWKKQKRINFCT